MDGSEAGIPIIFHCTSVSYPSTVITVSQFTPRDMWDFSWESGLFDYISSHLKSVRLSERRRDNDIFAACDSISPNHLLFNNFAYGIVRASFLYPSTCSKGNLWVLVLKGERAFQVICKSIPFSDGYRCKSNPFKIQLQVLCLSDFCKQVLSLCSLQIGDYPILLYFMEENSILFHLLSVRLSTSGFQDLSGCLLADWLLFRGSCRLRLF